MLCRELLGLNQGFARDGGNVRAPAAFGKIIGQFIDAVGRGAVQCIAHFSLFSAGRIQCEVFYLIVWNQKLGRDTVRFKRFGSGAQAVQRSSDVSIIKRDFPDEVPTIRYTVHQAQAVKR